MPMRPPTNVDPASLAEPHSFHGSVTWQLTHKGLEVGDDRPRTPGEPVTAGRIWRLHHKEINRAAWLAGVPVELLVACAATESRGLPQHFERREPGYESDEATPELVSLGPCHLLISTARWIMGDRSIGRKWLLEPANNFLAAAHYIDAQAGETYFDPPKVAAAYNAGSLRPDEAAGNRWKMHCYPTGTGRHVERFVAWYNDAAHVLSIYPCRPSVTMLSLFP